MRKILTMLFVLFSYIGYAQPAGDEDVLDVPVDGGLILLTIAGIYYGIKEIYKYTKKVDINI